jgi:predicted GNAT family acetyltransferase
MGDAGKKPVFVRGKPADAERLMELQEGYEREEVMPPGDPFNRNTCLAGLTRNLGSQIIFFVRAGHEILAKAGTNARGFRWDQLGGVYTQPEWRGKGVATALVAHISRMRMAEGRKIALFVKTRNEPAICAYRKAGFRADVAFRISYF